MALVKCKECGAEISTKAKACPKCGAEIKVTSGCAMSAAVILVAVVGLAIFGGTGSKSTEATVKALPAPASAEELAKQPDRVEFIGKLTSSGLIQKIEMPGSLPHVWVTPAFLSLDFDDKSKYLNVVYAYYKTENSSYNMVVIYNSRTGEKIGTFNSLGLDLDA